MSDAVGRSSEWTNMDRTFPRQLFPHFYLDGPPEIKPRHCCGGWGSYERLLAVNPGLCDGEESANGHRFETQHTARGEEWLQVKPAVAPLMPPCKEAKVWSNDLIDPMEFPEQMQYFYQHYYMDAFSTMGNLLQGNLTFKRRQPKDILSLRWSVNFLKGMDYKRCEMSKFSRKVRHLHNLLSDVVSDVPQSLLASLVHEELTYQSERQQFCADTTGGALEFVRLYDSQDSGDGCLIYPAGAMFNQICFHRVEQTFRDGQAPSFVMSPEPFLFCLNGTVKQISSGYMEDSGNVAVRSDYHCGVWAVGEQVKPRLVDVIQTKDRFSCVNVSPHLPNELVVANERGAAYLWTPTKQLQKFREEDSNLYFNAKSKWHWCDFSCHPRVMVYADRTGAELTDIRSADCNHTLFRIGKTPACVTGERVILVKHLGDVHSHHHLINTQFSSYIMDERLPSVPVLKWEHMMNSPPLFACALPPQTRSQNSKLLLGAQRSQEIMLLQYTGGRERACQAKGPIQKLSSPNESLGYLNHLPPHQKHVAHKRLSVPAAGLAAVQNKDYLSVFQLTETGDIFYQTLKMHTDQTTTNTEAVSAEPTVETRESETPRSQTDSSDHFNDSDSETEGRRVDLSHLEVIDNVDNELNENENISEPPNRSVENNTTRFTGPLEKSRDADLQVAWNEWLRSLFTMNPAKKQRPLFRRIRTSDIKGLKGKKLDKLEEDRLTSLRKDLKDVMRKKDLLVHGVTYLPHLNVTPIPHPVNPDHWPDDVSQRLALSWDGQWKAWWEEKLGLNRDKKIAALRRKRRREKQARSRSRTSLSGSFTSSVSYQDSICGLSSTGSQYLGSDDETLGNSTDAEDCKSTTEMHRKSPVILRRFLDEQAEKEPVRSPSRCPEQEPPASSSKSQHSLPVKRPTSSTPNAAGGKDSGDGPLSSSALRMLSIPFKSCNDFYLSSLPTTQTSTQHSAGDGGFNTSEFPFSPPAPSVKRAPQLRSSSQASQPRKKSRMGF